MHQTFYIDIEEEISSVIDRLNKSMSTDNYFVVPKRAIFLQSIVNLKLLKREADKLGKHIIIVTQDDMGASMAQRCGIDVRSALDGLEAIKDVEDETIQDEIKYENPKVVISPQKEKQVRLNKVGSVDFYNSNMENSNELVHNVTPLIKNETKKVPVNSILNLNKRNEPLNQRILQNQPYATIAPRMTTQQNSKIAPSSLYQKNLNLEKEKSLERMYSVKEKELKETPKSSPPAEKKIKKVLIGFIVLCLLAGAVVIAYLFVPSAKIIIELNILKNKIDINLHGANDIIEIDQTNIPIRIIQKEQTVILPYEVKGSSAIAGKKAHGTVVIYNEFDNSAQTLIATTRLESPDGKTFRLVKNTVVPGTTTIAGEIKPGAITAEIIADQTGTEYNIEPAKFTIPGFKGGPKFEKFYAKSSEPIIGGSADSETGGGGKVSQKDIDNAKQATEIALKEKLTQAVNTELQDGEIALQQAEKITIIKSSPGVKVGDSLSTFNYTTAGSVYALVFSQNDVKKIMEQSLQDNQQLQNSKKNISKIEYGAVSADFEKNTFDIKAYGEVEFTPVIDQEKIKQELLGKADDELAEILRKYSDIKSVNVEFSPKFISRISQYSERVTVEVQNPSN